MLLKNRTRVLLISSYNIDNFPQYCKCDAAVGPGFGHPRSSRVIARLGARVEFALGVHPRGLRTLYKPLSGDKWAKVTNQRHQRL